jgi:hypothetical protein
MELAFDEEKEECMEIFENSNDNIDIQEVSE